MYLKFKRIEFANRLRGKEVRVVVVVVVVIFASYAGYGAFKSLFAKLFISKRFFLVK